MSRFQVADCGEFASLASPLHYTGEAPQRQQESAQRKTDRGGDLTGQVDQRDQMDQVDQVDHVNTEDAKARRLSLRPLGPLGLLPVCRGPQGFARIAEKGCYSMVFMVQSMESKRVERL